MAKVLVTGASGFIGRHLVSALISRGDEVACLVRPTSRIDWLKPFKVQLVHGDVTEPERAFAIRRRAGLRLSRRRLHAGLDPPGILSGQPDRRAEYRRGVRETNHSAGSLDGIFARGGGAGDLRATARSNPIRPCPVSVYGRSKRAGEIEAESLAGRVPITIVRPPIVLGEGDKMGLSMFWSIDRFGLHVVPSLGRNRFSLIHAADLAELMIGAAERGQTASAAASERLAAHRTRLLFRGLRSRSRL